MKVFVVTSGDYDDYRIENIFSTKEKVDNFVNAFRRDDVRIEVREVDEGEIGEGLKAFKISMNEDGNITDVENNPCCFHCECYEVFANYKNVSHTGEKILIAHLFARSEEEAIKIVKGKKNEFYRSEIPDSN